MLTMLGYAEEVYASVRVDEAQLASGRVRVRLDPTLSTLSLSDRDGRPLPGARLRVRMPDDASHWAYLVDTDARGEVSMALEQDLTYFVDVMHPGLGSACDLPVRVESGRGELVLDASAALSLRLLDGVQPLPGVSVRLRGDRPSALTLSWHYSDGEGRLEVPALGEGRYRVAVAQQGLWPTEQVVEAHRPTQPAVVQVRRLGGIELVVRRKGLPLAGAVLELASTELEQSVATWIAQGFVAPHDVRLVTDEQGRASVRGVPHGSYRWSIALGADGVASGSLVVPALTLGSERIDLP